MKTLQKQLPEVFFKKKLFLKFHNIHSKIPAVESLFNNVALQHRCFPVNIEKFLRTFFEEHLQTVASALETIIFDEALQQFFKALECAIGMCHSCFSCENT